MTWVRVQNSLLARPSRPPVDAVERALLDAVIAAPDDDAPRLVYADWLAAHADPVLAARGELVVVQCALEAIGDPAEHNRLKARDFELIGRYGSTWCAYIGLGEVRNNFYASEVEVEFRRGFIETAITPLATFAAVAVPLFTHETPRHLVLFDAHPETFSRLGSSVFLRLLRSLELRRNHGLAGAVHQLATAANVASLERLAIKDSRLATVDVDVLATSTTLASLRELVLHGNALGPDAAFELARSSLAAQLEVLELDGNNITDDGAAALIACPTFGRLRRLSLTGNPISAPTRRLLRARFPFFE